MIEAFEVPILIALQTYFFILRKQSIAIKIMILGLSKRCSELVKLFFVFPRWMQVLKESCEADSEQTTLPSSGSIGQNTIKSMS